MFELHHAVQCHLFIPFTFISPMAGLPYQIKVPKHLYSFLNFLLFSIDENFTCTGIYKHLVMLVCSGPNRTTVIPHTHLGKFHNQTISDRDSRKTIDPLTSSPLALHLKSTISHYIPWSELSITHSQVHSH